VRKACNWRSSQDQSAKDALAKTRSYHSKCANELREVRQKIGRDMFDKNPTADDFEWEFLEDGMKINRAGLPHDPSLLTSTYQGQEVNGVLHLGNGWMKNLTKSIGKEEIKQMTEVDNVSGDCEDFGTEAELEFIVQNPDDFNPNMEDCAEDYLATAVELNASPLQQQESKTGANMHPKWEDNEDSASSSVSSNTDLKPAASARGCNSSSISSIKNIISSSSNSISSSISSSSISSISSNNNDTIAQYLGLKRSGTSKKLEVTNTVVKKSRVEVCDLTKTF
jgi:hypothetical protein